MLAQDVDRVISFEVACCQPAGQRLMPNKRVSADLHVVGFRKIDERIRIAEVESGPGWTNGSPFECILGDDDVELALERILIVAFVSERCHSDRRSYPEAAQIGRGAQWLVLGTGKSGVGQGQNEQQSADNQTSATVLCGVPHFC